MNQTEAKQKEIINYSQDKLKSHFEYNDDFLKEYANIYFFYTRKFEDIVIDNANQQVFEELFYESMKSQFFNGYFIAREFIEHEETIITDQWWAQPNGVLKELVPPMLFDAAIGNLHEMIRTENSQKLSSWVITQYEDIRGLLEESFMDMTFLGSYRAFLDEKLDRNIKGADESKNGLTGILSRLNDLLFVDPQKYVTCIMCSDVAELWELHFWSSLQLAEPKMGEIKILSIPENFYGILQSLPAYQDMLVDVHDKKKYLVNVSVHKTLRKGEVERLVDNILTILENRNNCKREDIVLSITSIESFNL